MLVAFGVDFVGGGVWNYQYSPHKNPEERGSHLLCSRSLKSSRSENAVEQSVFKLFISVKHLGLNLNFCRDPCEVIAYFWVKKMK